MNAPLMERASALHPAFAALGAYSQFIIYRLEPSKTRPGKTDKFPVDWRSGNVANAHNPAIWTDRKTAASIAEAFGAGYGVGFVFTQADPFFFLDIDDCLIPDGTWSALAHDLCGTFAGAAVEVSQSGRGLHVIGKGVALAHRSKNAAVDIELYTSGRFVALTGTNAIGNADTDHTAALAATVARYFTPDPGVTPFAWTTEPCEGWNGPADDALLIERAKRSRSAASAFGDHASFADLWTADADALAKTYPDSVRGYDASSADIALAQHLAFWTGKNCERIQTLMLQSALNREKWMREDYLPRTILAAVARQREVLTSRQFDRTLRTGDTCTIFRVENIDAIDDSATKAQLPAIREIKVQGGSLPDNVREAEEALIEQRMGVFQRGGMIVRPTEIKIEVRDGKEAGDLLLAGVTAPAMIQHMTGAAKFVRWDARSKNWKQIDCPRGIVDAYLAGSVNWSLRVLSGIVTAPTLRSDGSLLDRPGYDTMTGLLFDTRGVEFPPIPARPTRDEARRALALFDELICKFPFATPEARAVALAGFLTICIRRMLPAAPLFGIDGTGAGSGKGLLADIIAIVGTGRQASPINTGANEEELEKRIASMMIRGDLVILLDNLKDPLDSAFLCTVLTQGTVSPRVLGESKTVKLPTHHMFMVTGNALAYFGDLNRRAITCLIDPKIENPSERVFDFDPIERAIEGRPRYVAAALTVLRAYQAAGRPKQSGKVMGSYGEWCRTVRDALLWLGEADPTVTCIPTNPDDPERQRFAAVVTAWNATIGTGRPVSAKEAGGIAIKASLSTDGKETRPELLDALQAVAAPMARANFAGIDPRRLSQWLGKKKGLVFSGLRFHPDDKSMHGRLWRLENVSRAGALDDDAS